MVTQNFQKSDEGAQAAWRGFSSQTLYIASRVISDTDGYEYYPEDIEDLVIKKSGQVIEAVQVKNVAKDLALSSLAATKTSKNGDGFFNRMCSLHCQNPSFSKIKVVYFHGLNLELQKLQNGDDTTRKALVKKLVDRHGLSAEDARWLVDSLSFEKVNIDELEENISSQIREYVPVMAAPDLAKDLLIQYISTLSKSKGCTQLNMWQEKIHEIGKSIATIDGFYKEYHKSLVRLTDLKRNEDQEQLKEEFVQGVSVHPAHIRSNLDFRRNFWMAQIKSIIEKNGTAVVKGISGQGKSTLCYRFLHDNYPEGCVFCVRSIATETQAENLVAALDGLGQYNKELIIYIDVQPGETLWAYLIQELQSRGLSIPVLISIRDEDYNLTPFNGKTIRYEVLELSLSKEEAEQIYNSFTQEKPHETLRTFDDAWQFFGGQGPLIEFIYLLTNNETLTKRLQEQVDALLQERVPDEWLDLLQIVCYAGRLGCSINLSAVKQEIQCATMQAAIRRFKDEYLIRIVDGDKLEALHPVRAQIISDAICCQTCTGPENIVFKVLPCTSPQNIRIVLLDYFSHQPYSIDDIQSISKIKFNDWVGYANVVKAMLWLDAKRYVDSNMQFLYSVIEKQGKGWLCYLPLDLSGIERPNELIAETLKNMSMFHNKDAIQKIIDEVKQSLTSLSIDYQATDFFIQNSAIPLILPFTDEERTAFGYALFWLSKRGCGVELPFTTDEIVMAVCDGELQPAADAIRGLSEHPGLINIYQATVDTLSKKLISEMKVLYFAETDDEVSCKFIPPLFTETKIPSSEKNENHYWRMKMLDILKQMYPNKEYIDIELVGVDFLRDSGIKPMDYKLHIHRSNRPNYWISELNGWVKTRISYSLRPLTWNEYIAEIDEIRKTVQELISDTIKLIEDIYKKGRATNEKLKKVQNEVKIFRMHTFAENLLPKSVVDPYCLYCEGNVKHSDDTQEQYYTMHQVVSVSKYDNFRKSLNDLYTSLDNFYNQFAPVLNARIKKQGMESVENPRLAMFNLYCGAKNLAIFQREYAALFSQYSSLPEAFSCEECELILTLVNMWRHVLDNPIRNMAIAYEAKQRYRKGKNYFADTLSKCVKDLNGRLVCGEKHAYICVDYDVNEDNPLEQEYTAIVVRLRNAFNSAIMESSDRWYCETQNLELCYVPLLEGKFSSTACKIPFYVLFDKDVACISEIMFPGEIESEVLESLRIEGVHKKWLDAIKQLELLKLYLQRYQQILQVPYDDRYGSVWQSFIDSLCNQVEEIWGELLLSKPLVDEMLEGADEPDGQDYQECLRLVAVLYNSFDEIRVTIQNYEEPSQLIQGVKNIEGIMLIMTPYVVAYSGCQKEV